MPTFAWYMLRGRVLIKGGGGLRSGGCDRSLKRLVAWVAWLASPFRRRHALDAAATRSLSSALMSLVRSLEGVRNYAILLLRA